jgi:nicotinamidase-related amidase
MELIVGRPALLVIDMQHDFLDQGVPLEAAGGRDIIPAISRTVGAARHAGVPVIFTQEAHRPGRVDSGREADPGMGSAHWYQNGSAEEPLPEHCVEGTDGIEIVDDVGCQAGDLRIVKRRYSCFLGTDLDLLMRGLGVQTLLVTGVDSNVCVLWTTGDGFQLDYHVRVLEDCTAGTTAEEHEAALLIIRALTMGRPVYSWEIISALRARAPSSGPGVSR